MFKTYILNFSQILQCLTNMKRYLFFPLNMKQGFFNICIFRNLKINQALNSVGITTSEVSKQQTLCVYFTLE